VNELQFAEDVLARIRARGGQYHERSYLFVLAAIEYLQTRLDARRHVVIELGQAEVMDQRLRQLQQLALDLDPQTGEGLDHLVHPGRCAPFAPPLPEKVYLLAAVVSERSGGGSKERDTVFGPLM